MSVLKSAVVAGIVAASLVALAPVKPAVATNYISSYGMYQRNGLWHSSNGYVEYIIQHESSGRPWATNYLPKFGPN